MAKKKYKLTDISGQELEGKLVQLKKKFFGSKPYDPEVELFVCTGGFGCGPRTMGSAVFGYFITDNTKLRVERYDIEGIVTEVDSELFKKIQDPYLLPKCPKCKVRGKLEAFADATIQYEIDCNGKLKVKGYETKNDRRKFVCSDCKASSTIKQVEKANKFDVQTPEIKEKAA